MVWVSMQKTSQILQSLDSKEMEVKWNGTGLLPTCN